MISIKFELQSDGKSVLFYPSDPRYPRFDVGIDLREGESASDHYEYAAERIEAAIRENLGKEFVWYEPTAEEIGLQRAAMVPRIMARWYAYNNEKLLSGAWSMEDFTTFMPLALGVSNTLHTLAFGVVKAAIMAFDHPLATDQAKADYIAIMEEAQRG